MLLNGLRLGPFKTSLSKRPPRSPEEIQIRVEKYIFPEETEKATANPGRHQSDKKTGGQDEHSRKDVRSRAGKYSEYTPSTSPFPNCSVKSVRLKGSLSQKFSK